MTLFEELSWRGFVYQVTHEELGETLERERMTLYCGFDPSADSLHIGSLLPVMGLTHFQRAGHTPIVLVGGGTGLIGDPSGKTDERSLLTKKEVTANSHCIQKQLEHFLSFEGENAAMMRNNADWLCGLSFVDFLRDIGKHFSVNVMLGKESVRQRLEGREHGISYAEFTYSLLQAYDFLYLSDEDDCRLQVGGSDQWGNIVAGMDLTRRLRGSETFGLTFPLAIKSDGTKFGKTESGNVWLDPARTSPYKFYQFWLNTADSDTAQYLKYFTYLTQEDILECERQIEMEPYKRAAQHRLAEEVTRLVHGKAALENVVKASQAMFGGDLAGLDEATLLDIFSEVPSSEAPESILGGGTLLVDVLVDAGVFGSKGEARRLIRNGGLYLNNRRVDSVELVLSEASRITKTMAIIRKGKKDYHLLRFVG